MVFYLNKIIAICILVQQYVHKNRCCAGVAQNDLAFWKDKTPVTNRYTTGRLKKRLVFRSGKARTFCFSFCFSLFSSIRIRVFARRPSLWKRSVEATCLLTVFFRSKLLFSLFGFSRPPSRNSDPGSHSRLFPPPHYGSCLAFLSGEDFSSFFPRRPASNCAYARYS